MTEQDPTFQTNDTGLAAYLCLHLSQFPEFVDGPLQDDRVWFRFDDTNDKATDGARRYNAGHGRFREFLGVYKMITKKSKNILYDKAMETYEKEKKKNA